MATTDHDVLNHLIAIGRDGARGSGLAARAERLGGENALPRDHRDAARAGSIG